MAKKIIFFGLPLRPQIFVNTVGLNSSHLLTPCRKLYKEECRQVVDDEAEAVALRREKAAIHRGKKDDAGTHRQNGMVGTRCGGGTEAGSFANHNVEGRGQKGKDCDKETKRTRQETQSRTKQKMQQMV